MMSSSGRILRSRFPSIRSKNENLSLFEGSECGGLIHDNLPSCSSKQPQELPPSRARSLSTDNIRHHEVDGQNGFRNIWRRNFSPGPAVRARPSSFLSSTRPIYSLRFSTNTSTQSEQFLKSLYTTSSWASNNSFAASFLSSRLFHSSAPLRTPEEKSKVEKTLEYFREELEDAAEKRKSDRVKMVKKADPETAVVPAGRVQKAWIAVKETVMHFLYGTWLLLVDIRIAGKLTWRYLRGKDLSRRERKQLVRTVADIFRMVPFSVFIIVPFMEFALPFVIKIFPGFLPSTFQEKSKQEAALNKKLKAKIEMAKFLQDTMEELAVEKKSKDTGEETRALKFARFIKKVRSEGGYVSNAELLKYVKLFEDELTLDNMSLSQLRALCKIVGVTPLGTPNVLIFQLRMKLRSIIADDQSIASEGGVDKLTVAELQAANRARGMRALGLSEQRLKTQLNQWLELSLNEKVPPSLLLWSRTMFLPEDMTFTDRLKNLFGQMPDNVAEQARVKLAEMEGGKIDNKARLELIRTIEEALRAERAAERAAKEKAEQNKKIEKEKEEAAALAADEKLKELQEETLEQIVAEVSTPVSDIRELSTEDSAPVLEGKTGTSKEGEEKAAKSELDSDAMRTLETVLHQAGGDELHEEKEDLAELKEQVSEHKEDVAEVQLIARQRGEELRDSKAARRLQKRVDKLINTADSLLDTLHAEREALAVELKEEPGSEIKEKKQQIVRINELVLSLRKLQKIPDETINQQILEALYALDEDNDGVIDVNMALEVIDTIGKENVKISPEQMRVIGELLTKEQEMEAKVKIELDQDASNPSIIDIAKDISKMDMESEEKKAKDKKSESVANES